MYTALTDFTVPGFPAFVTGQEYQLPDDLAATLEERGLVEKVKTKSEERRADAQKKKEPKE